MADFKKLKVWRKAHALALNSRRVAARIRGTENGSLRSQLVRMPLEDRISIKILHHYRRNLGDDGFA